MPDDRAADHGFTLIELMVVVLIIAILLAIAIPSFLGARARASDRAAQSNLRTAHTNELAIYADGGGFVDDLTALTQAEGGIAWIDVLTDMAPSGRRVFVDVADPEGQNLFLGAKSATGSCFWLRSIGQDRVLRFAVNDCTAIPPSAEFKDRW
ncbi:MAG: type pilus assembly protein PilA [Actinomycetota bacterium]|nr:type pilus assembly protein PilA [Actinomycetota bacterium]